MCSKPYHVWGDVSRGIVLEEALTKCQGSPDILNKAVMEGRVIRTKVKGIYIYWFPQYQYSRANVFENQIQGEAEKGSADLGDLIKAQEEQLGFKWGASAVIGEGLQGIAAISDGGTLTPTLTPQPLQHVVSAGVWNNVLEKWSVCLEVWLGVCSSFKRVPCIMFEI